MAGAGNAINETTTGITGFTGTSFVGNAVSANNVLVGGTPGYNITSVPPSATTGVPLISQGSAADPTFSTCLVAGGGTGATTLTSHGVVVGNGTSAVAVTAAGSTGTVLIGNTGADPTFSANPTATTITLSGGSPLTTYTHGTWTPALAFGGGSTGVTYQSRFGIYVKIGVLVWVSYDIVLTNKGSSTGNAGLTGLPFTSISGQDPGRGFFVENTSITFTALYTDMTAAVDPNATTVSFVLFGAAATAGASNQTPATNTMFANNTSVRGSFVYYANAE